MRILLDTGPLVAILNERDAYHAWSVDQARGLSPPFFTCEAVLAEAHFLLKGTKQGRRRLIELLDSGRIELTLRHGPSSLRGAIRLRMQIRPLFVRSLLDFDLDPVHLGIGILPDPCNLP